MGESGNAPEVEIPSWLSKQYLTEALRSGEEDPGLMVDKFETYSATSKGDNYASIILRVIVTYIDGEHELKKKSLIVKTLPASETLQRLLKESHLFDKEIYTYRCLFPKMRRLNEAMMITLPKLYPTGRCDALVLEDLSARGFKMPDRKKRLDLAHSFLVLRALARFHGMSFAVLQEEPMVIDNFPESTFSDGMRDFNSRFMPTVFNSLASVISTWSGYERFSEKMCASIDHLVDDMQEIISPKKDAFNVLNHGDFWVNNMLFRYNKETGIVEEVCLLDFQIIRYGSPALDLQCFMASSLQDGIREKHEDELLEFYHRELNETLESMSSESRMYSVDDLKREYQDVALFGFNMGCFFLAAAVAEPNEAYDMHSLTEESIKEGTANPMAKTFQGKNYKEVLQKHLLYYEDLHKMGVLANCGCAVQLYAQLLNNLLPWGPTSKLDRFR